MSPEAVLSAVLEFVRLGGPVVAILLLLSIVAFTVILVKLWQFRAAGVGRRASLENALLLLDRGERDAARRLISESRSHLRVPLLETLGRAQNNRLAERVEARTEARLSELERGFRVLDSIAQIAPLLGLFGTVLGMIDAFQSLHSAGSSVDPSALAGGIWVALLTTAVGLAVAMPTSLVLTWLEGRIMGDRIFADKALQTLLCPVAVDAAA